MTLRLGRRVIHQLRASLERDTGLQAATYLQEAGFAGGQELYEEFSTWLVHTRDVEPAALDIRFLGEVLGEFFAERGWGTLQVTPLGPAVVALDAVDWAEAVEGAGEFPSCHITCGMLADFFGRIASEPVAVMEVECRSRGEAHCRFLVGAPDTLATLYERMTSGIRYADAITGEPA